MKRLFIFLSIIILLNGCFKAPIKTGAVSEENRVNLSSLAIGMSPDQVLEVMGYPYSTQEKLYNNKVYEVWYYITEPTLLGQSKLITRNFTPLVFENGHLKGWGNNFYKYTFDIEGEKSKAEEDKRQQYTDDKQEWPSSEHRTIEPMGKSTKTSPSDQKTQDAKKIQCFPQSSSETPQSSPAESQKSSTQTKAPSTTSKPQTDKTSKSTPISTEDKTTQPQETSKDATDTSKDSKAIPASQAKPGCCKPRTTKTKACQKYKEPQKTQKEASSPADEKKSVEEKSPCEMRKESDESQGYNFWE